MYKDALELAALVEGCQEGQLTHYKIMYMELWLLLLRGKQKGRDMAHCGMGVLCSSIRDEIRVEPAFVGYIYHFERLAMRAPRSVRGDAIVERECF
jgi:hypothetical protein